MANAAAFSWAGVAAERKTPLGRIASPTPVPSSEMRTWLIFLEITTEPHPLSAWIPEEEPCPGPPAADSLTSIWASTDWLERDVWDIFGTALGASEPGADPDARRVRGSSAAQRPSRGQRSRLIEAVK